MLSKEVQDLVDRARQASEMIKSVDAGMAALRKQNEEMKAKIEEISSQPPAPVPAQPAPDGSAPTQPAVVYSLSDEDKAALLDVAKGFDDAIESLKDDIPANVQPPTPPLEDVGQPAQEQPQVADPVTHAQDAEAASQAQPLPGTGAPEQEAPKEPGAA